MSHNLAAILTFLSVSVCFKVRSKQPTGDNVLSTGSIDTEWGAPRSFKEALSVHGAKVMQGTDTSFMKT